MKQHNWHRLTVETPEGVQSAVAPVIISASRATDIPAFHADWFFRCLDAGYVKWVNPFNKKPQYVSFSKTRVVVFWTKNPIPILPYLPELDKRKIGYYFQFTLNDYEAERLEPGLPSLADRIVAFRQLSEQIGAERVIWRFDPLIQVNDLVVPGLLKKIDNVGQALQQYTRQMIFSFADVGSYAKVKRNLAAKGFRVTEFDQPKMQQIAAGIEQLNRDWGLKLATCAERIDLEQYGIRHAHCIDGELMARLFPDDAALHDYLGITKHASLFDAGLFMHTGINAKMKDEGQRKICGCVRSKDIGQYDTCLHLCVYCYANFSENAVRRNTHLS